MLEARIDPRQAANTKEGLLQDVELAHALADSLTFDTNIGALVLPSPEDDSLRMLVFRAHRTVDATADINPLYSSNRTLENRRPRNSIHGTGIYVGNSRASVSLYEYTQPDRETGVYLTTPMLPTDILDVRTGKSHYRRFGKLLARETMMHTWRGVRILADIDTSYADKKVVIVDKSPDTVLTQNIQVKHNTYPIAPLWYVLRDTLANLERVGTAKPTEPRRSFKLLQAKFQAKK